MVLYFVNQEFFHWFASPSILNNAIRTLFQSVRFCGIPGVSSHSSSIMSHVLAPSARLLKLLGAGNFAQSSFGCTACAIFIGPGGSGGGGPWGGPGGGVGGPGGRGGG
jgi:hypothetical protein